jgi:deazaflavin-dependent oxidoreductase (nitroreductase family)
MLTLWRLGLGPWLSFWPEGFGRYMVITHTGRKSGKPYKTPVNYAVVDGDIYCTAGFGAKSDWYQNMLANPGVEVWLQDGWWKGEAEDITDCEDFLLILREVLISSGFATPLFEGFNPKEISDEELAEKAKNYRLMRIRLIAARTGLEGPGDLAWVWPLATFLLLPLAFRRRKRNRR